MFGTTFYMPREEKDPKTTRKSADGEAAGAVDTVPFEVEDDHFDVDLESINGDNESANPLKDAPAPVIPTKDRVYFRCEKCSYQTQIRYLLDRHIAKHAVDQPFECSTCGLSDYDHSSFVDHLYSHQKTKLLNCPFCSYKSNDRLMKKHMPNHRPVEIFDCSMCEFSSNYVQSMKNHIEVYHTMAYQCKLCKTLTTKHLLKKHCQREHPKSSWSTIGKADSNVESLSLKCATSGTQVEPFSVEESPASPDPKSFCSVNDDVLPKSEVLEDVMSQPEEFTSTPKDAQKFYCNVCAFSTTWHQSIRNHMERQHTAQYVCNHCPVVMSRFALIEHSMTVHGVKIGSRTSLTSASRKPRISMVRSTATESSVDRTESTSDSDESWAPAGSSRDCVESSVHHTLDETGTGAPHTRKSIDEVPKMNVCKLCAFSSHLKIALKYHVVYLHTRKYQCEYCGEFMTKFELINHSKTVHGVSYSSRYTDLEVTSKVNGSPPKVVSDKSTFHSGVDEAVLHSTSSLPGEASACTMCDYSAKCANSLLGHMQRLHETLYICYLCPVIMTKHNLIEHCKSIHGVTIKNRGPFRFQKVRQAGEINSHDQSVKLGSIQPGQSSQVSDLNADNSNNTVLASDLGAEDSNDVPSIADLDAEDSKDPPSVADLDSKDALSVIDTAAGNSNNDLSVIDLDADGYEDAASGINEGPPTENSYAMQDRVGTSKTNFDCTIGNFTSNQKFSQERPMVNIHSKKYSCQYCSAIMTKYAFINHMKHKLCQSSTGSRIQHEPNQNSPSDQEQNPHEFDDPKLPALPRIATSDGAAVDQPVVVLQKLSIAELLKTTIKTVLDDDVSFKAASEIVENPKYVETSRSYSDQLLLSLEPENYNAMTLTHW